MAKFSIVIPAYNEEENLPSLLDNLLVLGKRQNWDFEIIVSNDNSSDKTGKICEDYAKKFKNLKVVNRKSPEHGMGATLMDGTKAAGSKIIVWVMADKSDELEKIPKMVKKVEEGFDLVLGSRYMPGGSRGELGIDKAFFSWFYTFCAKIIFGIKIHDITNAFRAFRKDLVEKIRLESKDFAISPEFAIKCQLKGIKIGEVPATYYNRKVGKTKFKMFKMGLRYGSLFKYRFSKID